MAASHTVRLLSLVIPLWLLALASTSEAAAAARLTDRRDPPCTGSFDWLVNGGINPGDCKHAIEKFWRLDVARKRSVEFEFVGLSGRRYTKFPAMATPRRYRYGSCTLVIANLNIFPPMDLPDPPRHPIKYSDISSFEELYQAANRVDQHCVTWLHQAGYQDTGNYGSLGVLLLATDSYEDKWIPEGVTPTANALTSAGQQDQGLPIAPVDIA